jgi:hypothetical protein
MPRLRYFSPSFIKSAPASVVTDLPQFYLLNKHGDVVSKACETNNPRSSSMVQEMMLYIHIYTQDMRVCSLLSSQDVWNLDTPGIDLLTPV